MTDSPEGQSTVTVAPAKTAKREGSLVLVAGSGRSGTSLFTGILQRLGFHVPQPEVPADETNPRGFAESQWVVDFHTRLLHRAGVQMSDARPSAWATMARAVLDHEAERELRGWLGRQFGEADHVIIKDPRLSWFLPLWRRCAEELGMPPRCVTVLRHPAAVVDSKQRSYGGWQSEVSRTAGWLNQSLFTERATRESPRTFVRYDDLLDDWTRSVASVGEALDLAVIRDVPAASIVKVHDFVDRNLRRSRATWDDFDIPDALREQIEEVWTLLSELADLEGAPPEPVIERLEAARAAYISLYGDAEAIAQSSIAAATRRGGRKAGQVNPLMRLTERAVPRRYRRKVPLRLRKAAVRALNRRG